MRLMVLGVYGHDVENDGKLSKKQRKYEFVRAQRGSVFRFLVIKTPKPVKATKILEDDEEKEK